MAKKGHIIIAVNVWHAELEIRWNSSFDTVHHLLIAIMMSFSKFDTNFIRRISIFSYRRTSNFVLFLPQFVARVLAHSRDTGISTGWMVTWSLHGGKKPYPFDLGCFPSGTDDVVLPTTKFDSPQRTVSWKIADDTQVTLYFIYDI